MRSAPVVAALAIATSAVFLSGCGPAPAAAEHPRPVLVVHPDTADAAATAFAGEIRAAEETTLSFRVGGNLLQRRVDVGDRVHRGDLLAVLDAGDLQAQARAAQAQLTAAQAQLERARSDQARYAKLGHDQLVSRSAIDAQNAAAAAAQGEVNAARESLQVARNQAAYTQLRAPRDGAIATRQAEAGQVVGAGQPVFTLAADGRREVAFAVPEGLVRHVRPGDPVQVELWSAPDSRIAGRVREVAPAADPASRTFAVRATLDDAPVAELGASARVYLQPGDDARVSVPLAALQRGAGGGDAVFVIDPRTSTVHLRPVQAGAFSSDRVPITRGIAASDWIVAAGGHLLRDGEPVKPVDRDNHPVR
ncbi:efflux RND transporter periplasmic adaptor subunit [Lysobacter sp. TY2-98]|uniref:efflux RND transporter periplasmic adaptor subunit n=1 Tax=Lysobacter sp. TY2-98 TaxID=2290922 RepID=UPI000E20170B|nr:efflux RND transporter periplasmic adaptor subunit [Lysobacter sp. TY2-98]AXK72647.1 efflux RND transporter periplasmic adaptor subunit [Lysobacter sp. TY2-98]